MENYEKTFAKVLFNSNINAVEVYWKGFATDAEYKETLTFAQALITTKKCTKWLSNMTNAKAVSGASMEWVKTNYIPKVYALGVRKAAFIVSKDVFNKIYANNIKSKIEEFKVELKYFDNRLEAENWLKN